MLSEGEWLINIRLPVQSESHLLCSVIAILRKILTVKANRKLNMSVRFKVQLRTTVTEINAYTFLNAYLPSELEMIKRKTEKIRSLQFNI